MTAGAPLHDIALRTFASDNYAGLAPEVTEALARANGGHVTSYGDDPYTARLVEVLRGHLGERALTWPVLTGTGANVVALESLLPRWGGVICAASAHIATDEGGAPEHVGGLKLLPVPTPDGKLTPELVDREAWGWGFEHRAQPLVLSLTQSTELGTCYSPAEIAALAAHAHSLGMRVHLDGARLANAAAHLRASLASLTSEAGIDVVSLGGTKNGALAAEAVVVLDPDALAAPDAVRYLRKATAQLGSKMRFVSAQLLALYDGDAWVRHAAHANEMAGLLRRSLEALIEGGEAPGLAFTQPTQANAVFAVLPPGVADRVRERFHFYDWDSARGEVRWMCSFDTTPTDVAEFVAAVAEAFRTA